MFKKRKEKLISSDISTIEYWRRYIRPGMKLNNSLVHGAGIIYKNFIVPRTFDIVIRTYREETSLSIRHIDLAGETNWYDIYRNGIPAEIIQEDIISPNNGIDMPF